MQLLHAFPVSHRLSEGRVLVLAGAEAVVQRLEAMGLAVTSAADFAALEARLFALQAQTRAIFVQAMG